MKATEAQLEAFERNRVKKNKRDLGYYYKKKLQAEYDELKKQWDSIQAYKAELKKNNPFWFYEPTTGNLSEERYAFLLEYLERDDIPQKLAGGLDVHQSLSSIRGASGGNQSSKTTTGCIEGYIKATGALPMYFDPRFVNYYRQPYPEKRLKRSGPQHVRVIGEDYQNGVLRNLIPTYRHWAPREYLLGGTWEKSYSAEKQILTLYHPDTKEMTGTIEFMSNKQDLGTFQGPPRHMIIYDEEPVHDVYKENLMRFTTADSLDVLFCMTPTKGLSWTYDLFTRGTDDSGNKIDWFQIASVCNPHANINVLREILNEIDSYDELRMRLLGEFISLTGLVYGKLFDHKIHVIKPFDTGCTCGFKDHLAECPYTQYLHFLGIDCHMVKDSCAVDACIDQADNFIVDRCYKGSVDVEEFKTDITRLMAGKRHAFSVFDPSNDSSITMFNGLNIFKLCTTGANAIPRGRKGDKYQGSIAAGVNVLKERLKIHPHTNKPRYFIMDRPENQLLIKSMKTLQRDSFNNEDVRGQKDKIQEGLHDHHAAQRYILQQRLNWYPHIEQTYENPISDYEAVLF